VSNATAQLPIERGHFPQLRARLRGTAIHTLWRSVRASRAGDAYAAEIDGVGIYLMFIGHARSAHSIVGALLDAHPRAVVSDEVGAMRYIKANFSRRQVMGLSIVIAQDAARRQRRKDGRDGRTYSYYVPGQSQGKWEHIDVLGDSDAGGTVQRLNADPTLLDCTARLMAPANLRFIHVVRNPFDNISTMMIRGGRTFEGAFARYFENCDALSILRPRIGLRRVHTVYHEDLIADARATLRGTCAFLGLDAPTAYLDACASILYHAPARSRSAIAWTPEMIRRVAGEIDRYDFLHGYSYDVDAPYGRTTA
jgi:hypothetical protein